MLFQALFGVLVSVANAIQGYQVIDMDRFQKELNKPIHLEMENFNMKDAPDVDGAFDREAKHEIEVFEEEKGKFSTELKELKDEEEREQQGIVPSSHLVPKLRKIEV
jgi:hypothetical protein